MASGPSQRSVLGPVLLNSFVMSIAFPLFTVCHCSTEGRQGGQAGPVLAKPRLALPNYLFLVCPVTASRRYGCNG